jgi:dipeptidyl aminopeptidase/acylaminoacyl peptidase
MYQFWLGLLLMCSIPLLVVFAMVALRWYLIVRYLDYMVRIFQEKPLFIVPRGQPIADAEEVSFVSSQGLTLRGCYLRAAGRRRGVILFGLEFGSNRWACAQYCQHLVEAGYDVFTFEPRNQGDSDRQPGYEPLQWVTEYEVEDTLAALRYLKGRPDADPRGIGLFGISKGAGAGLFAAAEDRYVRCCVTDGVFATYTVLVPYMRQWFRIYNKDYVVQGLLPSWYYGNIGMVGLRRIERARKCHFPHLESVLWKIAPRPLLMIHGGGDTYIKPEMARALFEKAGLPREFWLVENAKHNQALQLANGEYRRRVREFFDRHLAEQSSSPGPGSENSAPLPGAARL